MPEEYDRLIGEWQKTIFIYTILTCDSVYICKCHLFLVTLLVQSNKRSAFPHNGNLPAFIIALPSHFLITPPPPKGGFPSCLRGYDPFAQRGATLLPKGV